MPSTKVANNHARFELQERLLPGVSRTFALTIPELPPGLREAVTNAYLLCRIADTIEDDAAIEIEQKEDLHQRFITAVAGESDPFDLSRELSSRLSAATPAAELELVRCTARVIELTHTLAPPQQAALLRCIRIMCTGMSQFQHSKSPSGLRTVDEMTHYCYCVAGVVGEMLTELFCHHCDSVARNRDAMMPLAVAFGQGLQMTNILKDFWEDRAIENCWLPRELFEDHGLDLARVDEFQPDPAFAAGLHELIAIARNSLRDGLRYIGLLPSHEVGIRRFCLWAIGFALLTLKKIHRNPGFRCGEQVKISRTAVKATILTSNLLARHDGALSMAFALTSHGLPVTRHRTPAVAQNRVSH